MNQFFTDKNGKPILLLGLQTMNSSTGTPLVDRAIQAVKRYGGNVLEAPIYWNLIEPRRSTSSSTRRPIRLSSGETARSTRPCRPTARRRWSGTGKRSAR